MGSLNHVQSGDIAAAAVLCFISTLVVWIRIVDRRQRRKLPLAIDDYAVLFSLASAIALMVTTILWVCCYDLGADYPLSHAQARNYQILNYTTRILYVFTFDTAKIAIMLFYIKLTNKVTQKSYWTILLLLLGFLIFDAVLHFMILAVPCSPVSDFWNVGTSSPTCWSATTSATVVNIFNFIAEAVVVLAPIPMLWLAGLTIKQRIALGGMFSLASLIILASALKLRNVIVSHGMYATHDLGTAWIWLLVESNIALLVAASLPLKALLEGTFGAFRRRFSSPDTSEKGISDRLRNNSLAPSDPYDLDLIASLNRYPQNSQGVKILPISEEPPCDPRDLDIAQVSV